MENTTETAPKPRRVIGNAKAHEREFEIRNPENDEPFGMHITLRPDTDPKVKAVDTKFNNEKFMRRKMPTAEQFEANHTTKLIAAIVSWRFEDDVDLNEGEPNPEFTEANARKVFKDHPFIREQVNTEFMDSSAFFRK